MSTPKTITFRTDEVTFEKIEKLKQKKFTGNETSNSEVIRYAIDVLYDNQGKYYFDKIEIRDLIQATITTGFLRSSNLNPRNSVDFSLLASISLMIDEVFEEYSVSEIKDIYQLYNDEETITIGKLVRFKHRALPRLFLQVMGEWEEEYEKISDDEIADIILGKFTEESFKEKAGEFFGIK